MNGKIERAKVPTLEDGWKDRQSDSEQGDICHSNNALKALRKQMIL